MDQQLLHHQQYVVGNFQYQHLLDVVYLVALQNLVELNLDADLTCQVVAHLWRQLVVPVDVERHQLRMDYFRGAVDVELRHLKRMDYFLGAAPALLASVLPEFHLLAQLHLFHEQLVAQYCFRQSRALGQLLAQQDRHRVLRLIQQLTLDLLRPFWQRSSLRQLS
jgi:hypothetical protein